MANEWADFSRTLRQGDSHIFQYRITDSAGTAINIGAGGPYGEWSNFWHTAKLSPRDLDAAAVYQKTLGSGITIVTAATGLLQIEILPADTTTNLVYVRRTLALVSDVQGRDGNGRIWTSKAGFMTVQPAATRATS